MTCINIYANDVWSEEDIVAHGRAVINAQVSPERQQELQTIMLGHIAQMRTATLAELAEIGQVAAITEAQSLENVQARADMSLLADVLAHEAALVRLTLPAVTEPATITTHDEQGAPGVVANPAIAADAQARAAAQALIDGATQAALDLYALRNPPPAPEAEI